MPMTGWCQQGISEPAGVETLTRAGNAIFRRLLCLFSGSRGNQAHEEHGGQQEGAEGEGRDP